MGPVALLVHAEVFKTFREARAVSAGFDSQTVPPLNAYCRKGYGDLDGDLIGDLFRRFDGDCPTVFCDNF